MKYEEVLVFCTKGVKNDSTDRVCYYTALYKFFQLW